ncbi:MAG: hypothetical protein QJR01_08165 [Kyrpidia sp.]|nr:hypothetical protein [Kyrpidia sp.]
MPTIGLGSVDGGFTRAEARKEFLKAVDRVLPQVRQELLELVPLVGKVEGLPIETLSLLQSPDFAKMQPRTPEDVEEIDVELTDGRVVRTRYVTRSAWRETWDALLEAFDAWAKRWRVPPWTWMREAALATIVYAAAGWSRSWQLPPFEVHHEPVSMVLSVDLAIEPGWHARKRLDQEVKEFLKKAKKSQKKAKVWKKRDTDLDIRMEWAVYRILLGLSWKEISERTCLDHPDLPFSERGGLANSTIAEHVYEIVRLLGD